MLAEGTHFLPGTDARRLGHKSLAVNLSDLAAMGADPRWFLLALALPEADEPWLAAFAAGMFALADAHRIELVGGDTTRGPRTITITAIGTLPPGYALRRDAAVAGEDLWLSGATGEAALGLAHLRGRVDVARSRPPSGASRASRRPSRASRSAGSSAGSHPRRSTCPTGCSRTSGTSRSSRRSPPRSTMRRCHGLPRSRASPTSTLADECILGGGDDYELAFTAPSAKRGDIESAGRAAGVAVTRIGSIVAGPAEVRLLAGGKPVKAPRRGFDHFR